MKKYFNRKITTIILTIIVGVIFQVYDNSTIYTLKVNPRQELEYIDEVEDIVYQEIFLLDKNGYVAMTKVPINAKTTIDVAKEIIDILTIGGQEFSIPHGFRALIPSFAELKDISYKDKVLTVNFSKDFLDYDQNYEEELIESLVYSLTALKEVDYVILKVEGKVLTELPKTKRNLPAMLSRDIGINKEYHIVNTKDIDKYTVYYVGKSNGNSYYVPVTKYINNKEKNKDKVKIIIEELISGPSINSRLLSLIHPSTNLENYTLEDGKATLNFNKYILADINTSEILEEVLYSIAYSLTENEDVKSVIFYVGDEKIKEIN